MTTVASGARCSSLIALTARTARSDAYGGSTNTRPYGATTGGLRTSRSESVASTAVRAGDAERVDVRPDRELCGLGRIVKHRVGRAARDRLDADGPGAGEEIEHVHALDRAEDREHRLADLLGGGACPRRP